VHSNESGVRQPYPSMHSTAWSKRGVTANCDLCRMPAAMLSNKSLEEALQSLLAAAKPSVLRRRRLLVRQRIVLLRLLEEAVQLLIRHLLLLLLLHGQHRRLLVHPRLGVLRQAAQRARRSMLLLVQGLLVDLLMALLRLKLQVVLLLELCCQLSLLLLTQVLLSLCVLCLL